MPTLLQLLQGQDLGHLRIVIELWGLDQKPRDVLAGAEAAAAAMLDAELAREVIEALDERAQAALRELARAGGRIAWPEFVRNFGEVREMGAARRDREQPHLRPISTAEVLFYRGLLGRAFLETSKGPVEFAYLPEDFLPALREPVIAQTSGPPAGRAATRAEHQNIRPATDRILDDATTFLAALRSGNQLPEDHVLQGLLEAAGILQAGAPQAARVRAFLEMPRRDALNMLVEAWQSSPTFNELRLIPELVCEGTWRNQALEARQFILEQLEAVPQGTWWSLRSFVADIKQRHPDFQRPAGDYDSWFIRRVSDGTYLRGFESWDEVDGALVRFIIASLMHRLGMVDMAGPERDDGPTAFRRIPTGGKIGATEEAGKFHIGSQGRITASRQVPRAIRYQLARFCEWDEQGPDEYRFHLSPGMLDRAVKQGLSIDQILSILAKHSEAGIPMPVTKALKRWATAGTEARTENQVVLRVTRPEILTELRRSKAAKYLGEPLGPTSVIVKGGAMHKVAETMVELGLLVEDRTGRSK